METPQHRNGSRRASAPLRSAGVLDLAQCVETLRQRQAELEAEVQLWKNRWSRTSASEIAAHAYATELQAKIAGLELEISRGGEYVEGLLQQIVDGRRSSFAAKEEISRLTHVVAHYTEEKGALQRELDLARKSAIAEKVVMSEYVRSLKERLSELEFAERAYHLLRTHVEDVSVSIETEIRALNELTQIVQSSRFWSFKRILTGHRQRIHSAFAQFRAFTSKKPGVLS